MSLASTHDVADPRTGAAWIIERCRAAREAGLAVLSIGDHHAVPVPYFQNTPMLGRLLAEWNDRPAGCLFLVTLWHPVLMAEQIATLAAIARGPFIVQTGLGGDRHQFEAMGVDIGLRPSLFEEKVRVVRALLAGETVSSPALGLSGAATALVPPEPVEWWIGASAPAALDRAARLGDGLYVDAGTTPEQAGGQLALYLDRCAEQDRRPGRLAVREDVFVSEDAKLAREVGERIIAAGYRGGWSAEAVTYGTPEQVADKFGRYRELGFTDVITRQMTVPQELALESIRLLGQVGELVR